MYMRDGDPNPFGITKTEALFSSVSSKRLMSFLAQDGVTVWNFTKSCNDYGEFRFLTLVQGHNNGFAVLTFYGHGYHEPRGETLWDTWHFYGRNTWKGEEFEQWANREYNKQYPLHRAVKELKFEHDTWKMKAEHEPEKSERQWLHTELAIISDDDAAGLMLDDFGF